MVRLSHPYMTTEKPSTGKCILDGDGGGDQLENVSTLNSWYDGISHPVMAQVEEEEAVP